MRSRTLRTSGILMAAAALLAVSCATASAAPIVVNELNFLSQGWKKLAVGSGSSIDFVHGPATPPLGDGSLKLSTPTGYKVEFGSNVGNGKKLSDITSLVFSTYVENAQSNTVAPALNILLHSGFLGLGTTTVVFEPYYVGGLTQGTWQTWDALTSAKAWWVGGAPDTFLTWNEVLALHGTKNIRNDGIRIISGQNSGGAPYNNYLAYADNFGIAFNNGTMKVYDFEFSEPIPEPAFFQMGALAAMGGFGLLRLRRRG